MITYFVRDSEGDKYNITCSHYDIEHRADDTEWKFYDGIELVACLKNPLTVLDSNVVTTGA